MLNKGPHTLAAVGTLEDVFRGMQAQQSKNRPMLGPPGLALLPG